MAEERRLSYRLQIGLAETAATREPRLNHQGTVGYVYLLTNPAFDGWVKVGSALDNEDRLNSYQTSDPYRAYTMQAIRIVEDRGGEEDRLHELFRQEATEANNEWFKIDLATAITLFRRAS